MKLEPSFILNTKHKPLVKLSITSTVPPRIISHASPDTVTLNEGESATLMCNVTGIPQPNVTWYRRNQRNPAPKKESRSRYLFTLNVGHEIMIIIDSRLTFVYICI